MYSSYLVRGGYMDKLLSTLIIEEELIKALYFNHKIDFFQFTDALLLLREKYNQNGKDTQLAITM